MSQPTSPSSDPLMDDDAQAMAAAMGFSSFGTQDQNRPSKKRRFNNDAIIAGLPPKPAHSGANSLPLHPRESSSTASSQSPISPQEATTSPAAAATTTQNPTPTPALPPKPDTTNFSQPPPHSRGNQNNNRPGRNNPHNNKEWYLDYYDPSSNTNPWDRLEQNLGLSSLSTTWLPNGHHQRQPHPHNNKPAVAVAPTE
ncbi:hypothetical protein OQA88_12092 [Cercophora sp. LCS_1]